MNGLSRMLLKDSWIYQDLAYKHHQKLILVDVALTDAKAFVICSNLCEEYWDDDDHAAHNALRHPYPPWRDAGVMIQGPVVRDIAENIKENWELMEKSRAEAMPDDLVADGLVAEKSNMLKEDGGSEPPVKTVFDFRQYQKILETIPLLLMSSRRGRGHPVQILAICAGLGVLVDVVDGLLSGTLRFVRPKLPPAGKWDGRILEYSQYKPDSPEPSNPANPSGPSRTPETHALHPAQFTRTFCQEKMEKEPDFSTVHALYRAVSQVQEDGLIYIENQYFRDPNFVRILDYVKNGFPDDSLNDPAKFRAGKNFYLVIITSDTSQTYEGLLSSGPTYETYQELRAAGIPFHFCKLRTKEHDPTENGKRPYQKPRYGDISKTLANAAFTTFRILLDISPLVLVILRERFRDLRNLLWAALPPLLDIGAHSLGSNTGVQRQAQNTVDQALRGVNHLLVLLLTMEDAKNPLRGLAARLRDHPEQAAVILPLLVSLIADGPAPELLAKAFNFLKTHVIGEPSGPLTAEAVEELKKRLPKTPEQVPVPDTGQDPGNIYVHSKVLLVDDAFCMIGSANHNERSMWHDTEDMLSVRGTSRDPLLKNFRTELIRTVLCGNMPDETSSAKRIFKNFTIQLNKNVDAYLRKETHESLVFPYIPGRSVGSIPFS
jgi:phosphatidylserine/phosphatidylglycerophosphate/cardiolipin synthase-like enzyme